MNTLLTLVFLLNFAGGTDPKKDEVQDKNALSDGEIKMELTDLYHDIEELMKSEDGPTVVTEKLKKSNTMLRTLGSRNMLRTSDRDLISGLYQKVEKEEMSKEDLEHYMKLMTN